MPEGWEVLEIVGTEEEAELIAGFLHSRDIPCEIESTHSHGFPVNVSVLGEVRLEVPTEYLPEARRLLAVREGEAADQSDWEEGSSLEEGQGTE